MRYMGISDRTLEYLLVNGGARAGRFYLLPKLHKRGCPGRPVISGCNTPTEKISAFVDHHLKPLVAAVPSYVKDTNDFLKKLRDISTLPSGAIMVTIDVVGLYPHYIPPPGVQASGVINDRLLPQCWSEIVGPHSSGNDWPLRLKAGSKIWVVVIGMR